MNIQITDSANIRTIIGVGGATRSIDGSVKNSSQIKGWLESNIVMFGSGNGTVSVEPFKISKGGASYNAGTLFLYSSERLLIPSNVVIILWSFKPSPKIGDNGIGRLNRPPAKGFLLGGEITWLIQ